MVEYTLKQKLLKEISEAVLFNENYIFPFCLDNDTDLSTVTLGLNNLISSNKVQKMYYYPYKKKNC